MTATPAVSLRPAEAPDLSALRRLLSECELPLQGVDERLLASTVLACSGSELAGSAALEIYPGAGLLRSVAVKPAWRRRGLGSRLVKAILDLADRQSVHHIYLLTDTAPDFFSRLGFQRISRSLVSPVVRDSVEFTTACPDTALAMELVLAGTDSGAAAAGDHQAAQAQNPGR